MKVLSILWLLCLSVFPAAARISGLNTAGKNIVEILEWKDDHFGTLLQLLEDNNLNGTLATGENFTLFAPTNLAFKKIERRLSKLTEDQVKDVLLYHVVSGKALSSDLSDGQKVATLRANSNVTISIEEKSWLGFWTWNEIYVNDAFVIYEDMEASNGVIHVIDDVLIPEDLTSNSIIDVLGDYGTFNSLLDNLDKYNLTDTIKAAENITLLAPTNYAFKKIEDKLARFTGDDGAQEVSKILQYHVLPSIVTSDSLSDQQKLGTLLPDDEVTVSVKTKSWWWWSWTEVYFDDAFVMKTDIEADNGIFHVVDSVLVPESVQVPNTIVDIAIGNKHLSTLVSLLVNASLVDTLKSDGPFTVFAPTNEAFEDIANVLPTLTQDQVKNVLLYHVVDGKALSKDLKDGDVFETKYVGNSVTVSIEQRGWFCWFFWCETTVEINESEVIKADVEGSNGVVHVIDKVLIPSNL